LRWMIGVSWQTPGYMMREELQREKDEIKGRKKGFEERLAEGRGSELARKCWGEIRKGQKRDGGYLHRRRKDRSFLK